jgi:hypothetical protein
MPEKNVALARNKQPVTVDGQIHIGTVTLDMPSEEEQHKGFYVSDPGLLIQQYRGVYKHFSRIAMAQEVLGGDPDGR